MSSDRSLRVVVVGSQRQTHWLRTRLRQDGLYIFSWDVNPAGFRVSQLLLLQYPDLEELGVAGLNPMLFYNRMQRWASRETAGCQQKWFEWTDEWEEQFVAEWRSAGIERG